MKTNTNTTQNNNNTKSTKIVKKSTKKIKNWHEYNKALEKRGCILLCIEDDVARGKFNKPLPKHTIGRPKEYSDSLVELILMTRALYHLPLRQVAGFMRKLFKLYGYSIKVPSYVTLSRRAGRLNIKLLARARYHYSTDGLVLCLDSSGFKIHGEGEWKVRKHGTSKRRTWMETHISIDENSLDIISIINTANDVHDNTQVMPVLVEAEKNLREASSSKKLDCIIGDGAYFARNTLDIAASLGVRLIAPPHKNAKLHKNMKKHVLYDTPGWEKYNSVVREVMHVGLKQWKNDTGYHRRSLVENTFFRLKTIFDDKSHYRTISNQKTEQMIRAKIINRFNELGLPRYT